MSTILITTISFVKVQHNTALARYLHALGISPSFTFMSIQRMSSSITAIPLILTPVGLIPLSGDMVYYV